MFTKLLNSYRKKRPRDDSLERERDDHSHGKGKPDSDRHFLSSSSSSSSLSSSRVPSNVISIYFHCQEGSVTHYFHFFYGALIPLIEYHLAHPDHIFRLMTDIGPLKRLILELPITIIELFGPDLTSNGRFHDDKSIHRHQQLSQSSSQRSPQEVHLPTYDLFGNDFYQDRYFKKKLNISTMISVMNYFTTTIPPYIDLLPTYDIVVIQRSSDIYYTKGCIDRQEIYRTSGDMRRSILNHHELVNELISQYPQQVLNIVLERSSLYFQYKIFSNAKIIIAQHGASLANIFFMQNIDNLSSSRSHEEDEIFINKGKKRRVEENVNRKNGKHVIEIMTPWGHNGNHFYNLSDYFNVNYHRIDQDSEHGNVNIEEICNVVKKCMTPVEDELHEDNSKDTSNS